jgi:hypothetical protein
MTTTAAIKQRAACLLVAQNKVTIPPYTGSNDNVAFVAEVRRQITEQEWRDTLYQAWVMILQEETNKLVSTYNLLVKEDTQ